MVFRDQTNRTIERSKAKRAKMAASTVTNHRPPSAHSPSLGINKMEDSYYLELQYFSRQQLLAPSKTSNLSPIVPSARMMRSQIFSSFLSECYPCNVECASDINMSQFILSGISVLPQRSPMLELALSALSCVFLGKTHHDGQFLQHGLQLYNRAICYMSNVISRNVYTDDMVYTSVVFQQLQVRTLPLFLFSCKGCSSQGPRLTIVRTPSGNGSLM